MFFDIALYLSLLIFVCGTIYRISTWYTRKIGVVGDNISASARFGASVKGLLGVIFSPKILSLLQTFFVDVLFQWRILKEDFLRWLMHILIFYGFMLLLLFHALGNIITLSLFPDYASTLNPFMFLRDLFGLMVVIGVAIAIYRRVVMRVPRLKTNGMDHYAIIILAVIMLSGIFLEGVKITSYSKYQEMVEDYADSDDEGELKALEAYWVQEYNLVSPNLKGPFEKELIQQGFDLHEMSCVACHSKPASAFTGYAVAKVIKPVAVSLDRAKMGDILWVIHILGCFFGLAYLPFSKMWHIIASPVSLLAKSVMDEKSDPANIATRQVMELDACTHCGTCSRRCSASTAYYRFENLNILPSEKMVALKKYVAVKELEPEELRAIQEGIFLCTNCDRCTVVCPVGINLRELWFNIKEEFIQKDRPVPLTLTPYSFYRGVDRAAITTNGYERPIENALRAIQENCVSINEPDTVLPLTPLNKQFKETVPSTTQTTSFAYCYACENCSTVCPVVENYENPQEAVGLLPHQIMRSLGLGLRDLALGSKMLWSCLTCYQCQEHCPQGVKVTDILYELKNRVISETFPESGTPKDASVQGGMK
jgi:heterodisulfide reductase subunit C/nitrate reductase gamma subunit